MGCNESKSTSLNQNNTAEDLTNNNKKAKLMNETPLKTSSFDSPSPIELQDENERLFQRKISKSSSSSSTPKRTPKLQKETFVSNAWATNKTAKQSDNGLINGGTVIDENMEFGREGIDIYSSSFDGTRTKTLVSQPDTEGIQQSNDIGQILTDDVPKLTKKYSEEPFDPRPLIDVDKFKAANTKTKSEIENNENSIEIPTKRIEMPQKNGTKTVISPSNYNEFYDDDEKDLMAAIEQDFHMTALPGVVV